MKTASPGIEKDWCTKDITAGLTYTISGPIEDLHVHSL